MMPEPSYYQQLFLRRIKREKQLIVLWRTAVFLLFLLIWECSARYGLIDSFIFSSPSLIWKSAGICPFFLIWVLQLQKPWSVFS